MEASKKWHQAGKSIGFVPTMGALHSGHEELLKKARAQNDIVVLSIFVNPTQFNDKKDLEKYPKTLDLDLQIAAQNNVDAVFTPSFDDIYPDNYSYIISENSFSKQLCGASRHGHFDGVLSIVMKLFNIIGPNRAYFGEKDFQQLTLINGMVSAFFMDIEIVPIAIVRENSGLAKSSRNQRLNTVGRQKSDKIYSIIKSAKTTDNAKKELEEIGFDVDYIEDINGRRFVAVKCYDTNDGEQIRLIDNVEI